MNGIRASLVRVVSRLVSAQEPYDAYLRVERHSNLLNYRAEVCRVCTCPYAQYTSLNDSWYTRVEEIPQTRCFKHFSEHAVERGILISTCTYMC